MLHTMMQPCPLFLPPLPTILHNSAPPHCTAMLLDSTTNCTLQQLLIGCNGSVLKPINHGQCTAAHNAATLPFAPPSQTNHYPQPSTTLLSDAAAYPDYQQLLIGCNGHQQSKWSITTSVLPCTMTKHSSLPCHQFSTTQHHSIEQQHCLFWLPVTTCSSHCSMQSAAATMAIGGSNGPMTEPVPCNDATLSLVLPSMTNSFSQPSYTNLAPMAALC